MKKFQLKLVSERFVTIAAENEDQLLKKIEEAQTKEMRDLVGQSEWWTDTITEMPDELDAELVLQDGKFWSSN